MQVKSIFALSSAFVLTFFPLGLAAESFPNDFVGQFGYLDQGFCDVEIKRDVIQGLFDGGGSCRPVSLRLSTMVEDPHNVGVQGAFSCFYEGSEWQTEMAIWMTNRDGTFGRPTLTIVGDIGQSNPENIWLLTRDICG